MVPIVPNASGLAGRIATCIHCIRPPESRSSTILTKSKSPTLTPPLVDHGVAPRPARRSGHQRSPPRRRAPGRGRPARRSPRRPGRGAYGRLESRIWPGRSGSAALDELVTRRQHADPSAWEHGHRTGCPRLASTPRWPGVEPRAGREHQLPGRDVVARFADVVAGADGTADRRPWWCPSAHRLPAGTAIPCVGVLDHDDGVSSGRHRGTGEDPDRLARADEPARAVRRRRSCRSPPA